MSKYSQSKAEIRWLEKMSFIGFDELSEGRSFGQIEDKEGQVFKNIPDAIAFHRLTQDLYIFDHKTCELNSATCKRTADNNKKRHELRRNKGQSYMASWSNSFYQKSDIQKAFRGMVAGNVYYVVVTPQKIQWKTNWKKLNPFVLNLTEAETYELSPHLNEVQSLDNGLAVSKIDGRGILKFNPPVSAYSYVDIPLITVEGLEHKVVSQFNQDMERPMKQVKISLVN